MSKTNSTSAAVVIVITDSMPLVDRINAMSQEGAEVAMNVSTAFAKGSAVVTSLQENAANAQASYNAELAKTGQDYNPAEIVRLGMELNKAVEYLNSVEKRMKIDFEGYTAPKFDKVAV